MWGIIPAAGRGSRMDTGGERPCAVSEYLVERMIFGGAAKIAFVISPGKSDIIEYYGASYGSAALAYLVQPYPSGLCDSIFRPHRLFRPMNRSWLAFLILFGFPKRDWPPCPTTPSPSCCFP